MTKSFLQRKHKNPDYEVEVDISGVRLGTTGKVHWKVNITDYSNEEEGTNKKDVVKIFEKVIEVLKDE